MPRNAAELLPSPRDTGRSTARTSSSKRSVRSAASVHDADFRDALRYRNIFIERENPPTELVQRARGIIMRPRASPGIDETTAQAFRDTARRLQTEGEQNIIQKLVPIAIPVLNKVPDHNLAYNSNQAWCDSVPIPLDPSILANPLPLPKPKPDAAFGHSEQAFTRNQLGTIDLLVDDQHGRSYAVPDKNVRFPFLNIEFKSQAKNGTHYTATNQVANAGAIAMNGNLELTRRGLGVESLDLDEPQFFSISMDHELARINIHWLGTNAADGQFNFHVEGLSQHLLKEVDGLRAVRRAVKNILDYGADERLRTLCEGLDAYRQKVIHERETAVAEGQRAPEVQADSQARRPRGPRAKAPPLADRRPAKQTPPGRRARGDVAGDDGPDEAHEQPQGGRPTHGQRTATPKMRNGHSSVRRQGRQHRAPPAAQPVRVSSRLAAQARLPRTM